jgi:hypothetical protein
MLIRGKMKEQQKFSYSPSLSLILVLYVAMITLCSRLEKLVYVLIDLKIR